MRPTYQTQADSDNEDSIAQRFATAWGCDFVSMPQFFPVDTLFVQNGSPKAWGEIKRLHRTLAVWKSTRLDLKKVAVVQTMANVTGLPFLFCVQYDDCYAWTKIEGQYEVTTGGRTDRGDKHDIVVSVKIPLDRWIVLK
jgi:hypothetical protein